MALAWNASRTSHDLNKRMSLRVNPMVSTIEAHSFIWHHKKWLVPVKHTHTHAHKQNMQLMQHISLDMQFLGISYVRPCG